VLECFSCVVCNHRVQQRYVENSGGLINLGVFMTSPCSLNPGTTFLHNSQIGGNKILYSTLEAMA